MKIKSYLYGIMGLVIGGIIGYAFGFGLMFLPSYLIDFLDEENSIGGSTFITGLLATWPLLFYVSIIMGAFFGYWCGSRILVRSSDKEND